MDCYLSLRKGTADCSDSVPELSLFEVPGRRLSQQVGVGPAERGSGLALLDHLGAPLGPDASFTFPAASVSALELELGGAESRPRGSSILPERAPD